MSLRDVAVLVVAAIAVVVAAAWSVRHQRTWGTRWTAQLVAGVVCGVSAAVAVAVPFVDVVPDAEEGVVAAGGAVALVLVAAAVALGVGGRTRRARGQVPRS